MVFPEREVGSCPRSSISNRESLSIFSHFSLNLVLRRAGGRFPFLFPFPILFPFPFPFLGMDRIVLVFFSALEKERDFASQMQVFHPQIVPLEQKELLGLQDPDQQIHDQRNSSRCWSIIELMEAQGVHLEPGKFGGSLIPPHPDFPP